MNTDQIKQRLLAMFPPTAQAGLAVIIDTLIDRARTEGKSQGHQEAATMLEVLILGNEGDIELDHLTELMHALRRTN